jgi:hypothetical protein
MHTFDLMSQAKLQDVAMEAIAVESASNATTTAVVAVAEPRQRRRRRAPTQVGGKSEEEEAEFEVAFESLFAAVEDAILEAELNSASETAGDTAIASVEAAIAEAEGIVEEQPMKPAAAVDLTTPLAVRVRPQARPTAPPGWRTSAKRGGLSGKTKTSTHILT